MASQAKFFSYDSLRHSVLSGFFLGTSLLILLVPMIPLTARGESPASTAQRPADPSGAGAQKNNDLRALEPAKPIERELAGGEVHTYQLTLVSGQYVHWVVDQRGINVVVTVFGPDGERLVEVDSSSGMQGPEQVPVVAKVTGTYRFEIRPANKNAVAGRYEA